MASLSQSHCVCRSLKRVKYIISSVSQMHRRAAVECITTTLSLVGCDLYVAVLRKSEASVYQ